MADDETKDAVEPKEEKTAEAPVEAPENKEDTNKDEPEEKESTSSEKDDSEPQKSETEIEPELTNEFKLPSANEQHPLAHKSMKKVLIGVVVVIVLAIFAAGALWLTHDDPVSTNDAEIVYTQGAAVTAVEGDVEFNAGEGWNEVTSGTDLKEGYSLRTLDASRAIITLDEGSAVRLDGNTVVTLTKLTAEEVIVDNESGQVYTRVVPSTTRMFVVTIGDQSYEAKGTAYKTVNQEDEKGVEVYHSKVDVKEKVEVSEGETYFTNTKDEAKKDKVAKLDLEKLADDDFLNWNKIKDENNSNFADKLGFIKDLGKKEEPEPEPEPTPGTPAGISLSGSKGSKGINVSWTVNGVNESDGFKVVYDKSDTSPTYGENSAKYMSPGTYSTLLDLTDGKAYNILVCAYRAQAGSCDNYSNLVTVTAPLIQKAPVLDGTINLQISGNVIGWNLVGGNAPHGFKVLMSKSENPDYSDKIKYLTSTQYELPTNEMDASTTYYIKVCKYTNGTESEPCVDYSNQVKYDNP